MILICFEGYDYQGCLEECEGYPGVLAWVAALHGVGETKFTLEGRFFVLFYCFWITIQLTKDI